MFTIFLGICFLPISFAMRVLFAFVIQRNTKPLSCHFLPFKFCLDLRNTLDNISLTLSHNRCTAKPKKWRVYPARNLTFSSISQIHSSDKKDETEPNGKQKHEKNNEHYLPCVRATCARLLCAFAARASGLSTRLRFEPSQHILG